MHMYTHMHIYTYMHIYICICIYIHIYTHIYIHIYIHVQHGIYRTKGTTKRTWTSTCVLSLKVFKTTHASWRSWNYVYVYIYVCTHTHIHTYIYTVCQTRKMLTWGELEAARLQILKSYIMLHSSTFHREDQAASYHQQILPALQMKHLPTTERHFGENHLYWHVVANPFSMISANFPIFWHCFK